MSGAAVWSADTPPTGTVRDWVDHRTGVAFVYEDGAQSWDDLRDEARAMAAHMTALGIAKGESVAILAPNGRFAVTRLFATLYGGFRAVMINLVAGDGAIAYALEHSEARFAHVAPGQEDVLARCDRAGAITPIGAARGDATLHDLSPQDDALLMYTSGTTGRPKGVVHTHASLLAGGWTTCVAHGLGPQDRGFCVLPIYHINGLCVTLMGALISGGSLGVATRFSASRFWALAGQLEVTWFSVVPTIISHLLHGPADPDPATRARLRFGRSASSALAPDVQTAFETRFGVPIIETMGLTETAAQILSNPMPPGVRKIGSPGLPYGNRVAILGPDFAPLPADQEGEIAVSGPNVMKEYLKNPEATAQSFTPDGWLRTGDLGRIDGDGYVFVTGRLKELIIKGGENIAPREIDEALYSHADVIEAAAFARPCKTYGERVEAAVCLRAGSDLTGEALQQICADRLGSFKSPDCVHILPDLPKGPSGKIQRLRLVDMTQAAR